MLALPTTFRFAIYGQEIREISEMSALPFGQYMHDNQLEESFLPGAELKKSITEIEKQLREQYQLAGIKTVR